MDFGRVDIQTLEATNLVLPTDNIITAETLRTSKTKGLNKIYIGCAKWGRKDWVGKLYPPKTKETEFLNHYATYFNSIELNATFYKLPDTKTIITWANRVGDDFLFCPKFTDLITHIRRLTNATEFTDSFLEGIQAFGAKLGPAFLQLPPNFAPKSLPQLESYLYALPADFDVFVELRHPDWFKSELFTNVCDTIKATGKDLLITDAAGRRDCVHMALVSPRAFIRFVGNGLHPSDYTRIDEWVQRIKFWIDNGLSELYFFMHQHDELHSPELIKYLILELNKACETNIKVPVYLYEQNNNTLF